MTKREMPEQCDFPREIKERLIVAFNTIENIGTSHSLTSSEKDWFRKNYSERFVRELERQINKALHDAALESNIERYYDLSKADAKKLEKSISDLLQTLQALPPESAKFLEGIFAKKTRLQGDLSYLNLLVSNIANRDGRGRPKLHTHHVILAIADVMQSFGLPITKEGTLTEITEIVFAALNMPVTARTAIESSWSRVLSEMVHRFDPEEEVDR
jgi:hypothetical protein